MKMKKFLATILGIALCFQLLLLAAFAATVDESPLVKSGNYQNFPAYYSDEDHVPNQVTHPDVVVFEEPWNNYTHWAIYTPNVMHISIYENPSIVASNDGVHWEIPDGLSNPIEPQPATTRDHNCDADMLYNPKMDALMAYWNWADDAYGGVGAEIRLRISYDGIHWGVPVTYDSETRIWTAPQNEAERQVSDGELDFIPTIHSVARYDMLSPTFVYDDFRDVFIMWANDAGDIGYQNGQNNCVRIAYSDDGITWGDPVPVEGFLSRDRYEERLAPWHQDVQYVKELKQFLCLSQCFAGPNPDGSVLYLTTSRDGVHWDQPSPYPLLSPGDTGSWDDFQIYRSSLAYDSATDMIRVWYSALQDNTAGKMIADTNGDLTIQAKSSDTRIWRIGYAENSYVDMMRVLLRSPDYTIPELVPGQTLRLITNGGIQKISVGDTIQLQWTFTPADTSDQIIKFTSSDPSVASVDPYGRISGVGIGTANITGQTQEGLTDVVEITVGTSDSVLIPQSEMSATASSSYDGTNEGPAANVLDGNPDTIWHTNYNPKDELPQHIILNLGKTRIVDKLVYTPRQNGTNGIIQEYGLYAGIGNGTATLVAHGEWDVDHGNKTIEFAPVEADKLILQVVNGSDGFGSAAEINVYEYIGQARQIPQSEMTATATSENVDGEPSRHVIDGNVNSIWHTNHTPTVDSLPQSITIHLDSAKSVSKFVYTPRQDLDLDGNVLAYELHAETTSGSDVLIEEGNWADNNNAKSINFEPVEAVAFTLTVNDGHGGFGSAAEINLYGPTGSVDPEPDPEQDTNVISGAGIDVVFDYKTHNIALFLVEGNQRTQMTSSGTIGYPIIAGQPVQDFENYECTTETGISGVLGTGEKMTITATSPSTGLTQIYTIETSDAEKGIIYTTVSYRAGDAEVNPDWFVGNAFELANPTDTIWSYNGGGEGPMHYYDTLQKISLTDGTMFSRENIQDYTAASIPVADIYSADGGIVIGDASATRREVHTPVLETTDSAQVSIKWPGKAISSKAQTTIGQSFVGVHRGDYYSGLRCYKLGMEYLGIVMNSNVPERSYELRWESWGWGFNWTVDLIIGKLDELEAAGVRQITLDDGWYTHAGDWELSPSKFPNGVSDVRRLTDTIHAHGMTALLWWRPCDGGVDSNLYKEHPEYFVMNADGSTARLLNAGGSYNSSLGYALCPVSSGAIASQVDFVNRAMNEWGFDGFKGDYVWSMPKCHNPNHNHPYPEESTERQADIYRTTYEAMVANDPDCFNLLCNCGTPQDYYSLQYMTQVATADPTSLDQTRRRAKAYKALMGDYFPITTDHNSIWYPSAVGTGSVLIEKRDLTGAAKEEYETWLAIANDVQLQKGRFIGDLYSYGFDPYETYVVEKDGAMFYAFFRDGSKYSPSGNPDIELKGLEPGKMYRAVDYVNNRVVATNMMGDDATFSCRFSDYLLLKVVEISEPDPEPVDPDYGFTSVDDRNDSLVYSGVWHDDSSSSFSEGTARYTGEVGAYVEFTFTGKSIRWYGQKDINFGEADVYLDGELKATINANGSIETNVCLYEVLDIPAAVHTIRVVCRTGTIDIDRFAYEAVEVEPTYERVNATSPDITYEGDWVEYTNDEFYMGSGMRASSEGAYAEFTFTGTAVRLYAEMSFNFGTADVYLDGQLIENVILYGQPATGQLIFERTDMEYGEHTIRFVRNAYNINLDYISYCSEM